MYGIEVEGWQLFLKEARLLCSTLSLQAEPPRNANVSVAGASLMLQARNGEAEWYDGWQQSCSSAPKVAPDKASASFCWRRYRCTMAQS